MMHVLQVATTFVPSPTPTVDPDLVTPGPAGFAVIALIAVGAILLITDMMRRIRRARVREDVREELDAELAAEVHDRSDGVDSPDASTGPDSTDAANDPEDGTAKN